jgi:hypothetical protein
LAIVVEEADRFRPDPEACGGALSPRYAKPTEVCSLTT